MTDRWYVEMQYGGRVPVAIDNDGCVLTPESDGRHLRERIPEYLYREGQVVPAAPGWYAVVAWWTPHRDEDGNPEFGIKRKQIVAWEAADPGEAFVVDHPENCGAVTMLGDGGSYGAVLGCITPSISPRRAG